PDIQAGKERPAPGADTPAERRPGGHQCARMASARARALAWRAAAACSRSAENAASRRAPRMRPSLATKVAASSRAAWTSFVSRIEVVVSEVKSRLRSSARIRMLLVCSRVRAWLTPLARVAANRTAISGKRMFDLMKGVDESGREG